MIWRRVMGWRWWEKALASLLLLIAVLAIVGAIIGDDDGNGDGQQVASQPTEAVPDDTGTQEPADQETAEPTQPPQPTDLPAFTSAECAYAERVQLWSEGMADAAFEMSGLFFEVVDNPLLLLADGWTIQMAAQLVIMRVTYDEASAATPPESMRTIHQKLVEALSKANDATEFIAQGIDNVDADLLEQGTTFFIAASDDLAELPELIDEFAATRSGSC